MKISFRDLIVKDKEIAESFNLIFSNIGHYFGGEYDSAPIYKAGNESFSFCPHKPFGPCKAPAWAIFEGQHILVPRLTFVSNECINDFVFPSMLKMALLTQFVKKVTSWTH